MYISLFGRSHCERCEPGLNAFVCFARMSVWMAFLLQSRRATEVPVQRRFPVWKAPRDACGPVRVNVNVNGYIQFCSNSCKEPHRLDLLANTQFLFSLSFRYWPSPLHFSFWPSLPIVRVLQEPVWTRANTNISCNALQPFLSLYSVLYKILHFCCFSSVEVCSPWEYCAHMGFSLETVNCRLCANWMKFQ